MIDTEINMNTITKTLTEQLNTCEHCGCWTTGHSYGYSGLNYFSVVNQFEHKHFFCSDECAEIHTGRIVI